jgi:Protein of unknown function (DUF1552)
MKHDATRRRFLRALGLGGAAAMLPSFQWRQRAQAAASTPTRLLILTTQHGAPREHWKMNVPGLPPNADGAAALGGLSQADFSYVLAPLHAVRNRLTVVEGLAMISAMLDQPGNNHGVSWAHLLTTSPADYENPIHTGGGIHPFARTMSIDQYIAQQVSSADMIPSLELAGGGRFGSGPVGFATAADGSWLPYENDPARAFDRLFPVGPPTGEPRAPTRRELIAAQRPSVLDLAAREYERVIPDLGTEDRRKLEMHRDQIRALEQRLGGNPLVPTSCDSNFTGGGDAIDQFFRLTAIAFACNLTRVVTINLDQLEPADFGAPPGDVHQDYAHGETPEAYMHMANYYRYHAEQFSDLVGYLDAVPEGGGTLLDNTMVIWITELSTGPHDMADGLTIVAGGGGGALEPGRYVRFAQNRPSPCSTYGCQGGADVGPGQSHLFVSAMQAMGMPDDSFGTSTGTALDGSPIDMTGPLPLL